MLLSVVEFPDYQKIIKTFKIKGNLKNTILVKELPNTMLQRRFNLKEKPKMSEDKQITKHDLHLNKLKTHSGLSQTDPSTERGRSQEVPFHMTSCGQSVEDRTSECIHTYQLDGLTKPTVTNKRGQKLHRQIRS